MNENDKDVWSYRKIISVQCFLLITLFFIAWSLFGFNLENYEAGVTAALNGTLMQGNPFTDVADMAHIFTMKFYAYLESHYSSWHPYNLILLLAQFLSIQVLMFFTWLILYPVMQKPWRILAVQIGIFIMIDFDNMVNINLTRIAFFSAGSGILALIYLTRLYPSRKVYAFIGGMIFFFYGLLTRFEAAELVLLYLGVTFVTINYHLRKTLILLSFPISILLITFVFIEYTHGCSFIFQKIDRDFYYEVLNKKNLRPLKKNATTQDSLLYQSAMTWTLSDTANINYSYYNNIVFKKSSFIDKLLISNIDLNSLSQYFKKYSAVLLLIFFFNCILFFSKGACRNTRARLCGINIFFWCLIIFISSVFKTEYRLLSPMLYFYLHSLIILASYYEILPPNFWNNKTIILISTIIVLSIFSIKSTIADGQYYKAANKKQKDIQAELKTMAYNKYLVLDGTSVDIIASTIAFTPKLNLPVKKILLYDFGPLWLLPQYSHYLSTVCHCSPEWDTMYDFLYIHKAETIYVTTEDRSNFINRYLKFIHHKKYHLKLLNGKYKLDEWDISTKLNYYTIVDNEE